MVHRQSSRLVQFQAEIGGTGSVFHDNETAVALGNMQQTLIPSRTATTS